MSTTIIIRDNEIRIFKNIMDFYKSDTLDDVVTELFKEKLTTANEHHYGEGIFDVFSDDGNFIRTSIPLKHIFERNPVACSQAKKLCFRFENFIEVILDFDGISWIGQSFSDEIFRVYQKKNPNLKFIVKNSNKDIDKMIHHVKCS